VGVRTKVPGDHRRGLHPSGLQRAPEAHADPLRVADRAERPLFPLGRRIEGRAAVAPALDLQGEQATSSRDFITAILEVSGVSTSPSMLSDQSSTFTFVGTPSLRTKCRLIGVMSSSSSFPSDDIVPVMRPADAG